MYLNWRTQNESWKQKWGSRIQVFFRKEQQFEPKFVVAGCGVEPPTFSLWDWRANHCSTPQYVRGSTKCGDRTFLLFLYGKKWENLRLQFLVATPLMTLCFSHFIHLLLVSSAHACLFTTPAQGSGSALFTLNEHLLDYLSTTNLAGCSWLLRQYSFNSIKYIMLVTLYIPHCLPLRA